MNGVAKPPSPKKRLTRFRVVARCSGLTLLASEFAPVTITPPPRPSMNMSPEIVAKLRGPRQREQGNRGKRKTEHQACFLAFRIHQRTDQE